MAKRQDTSPKSPPPRHWLEERRRKAGRTLDEIADSTKISIRFLRAIEAEDYGQLPGGIFNISYIRQYAAAIDFDEEELLSRYHARMAPDEPAGHPGAKPPRPATAWFRGLGFLKSR